MSRNFSLEDQGKQVTCEWWTWKQITVATLMSIRWVVLKN